MSHVHGNPSLNETELPTIKGTSVPFWEDGEQYSLYAHQTYAWGVLGPARPGRLPHIGDFSKSDDGYVIMDDRRGPIPAGDDWRAIVRRMI